MSARDDYSSLARRSSISEMCAEADKALDEIDRLREWTANWNTMCEEVGELRLIVEAVSDFIDLTGTGFEDAARSEMTHLVRAYNEKYSVVRSKEGEEATLSRLVTVADQIAAETYGPEEDVVVVLLEAAELLADAGWDSIAAKVEALADRFAKPEEEPC